MGVLYMKSFIAKKNQVEQDWRIVDADGQILGRLAVKVAMTLMGKTKPTYTPHVDTGDFVVVINADKIRTSGTKADYKQYHHYTRYPGGYKTTTYAEMMERHPDRVIRLAVQRMLPKNKLGRHMLKKLKIYAGTDHPHAAQQPVKMEI
jgi:large subunit ribosomal protein L13